jgi:hypothetical protein
MVGVADSVMEINSTTPASSTWKLNRPKAISKPLIFVEADPVERGMGSTIAAVGLLMAVVGAELMKIGGAASTMVGEVVSMMVGEAVSTSMGDAELMAVAGDEPTMLVTQMS